jgi:hypothetical protein
MRPDDLREAASALEDRDPAGEAAGAVDALRAAAAEIERLRAALEEAEGESKRLDRLLRRPRVWAAHAAEPGVTAPECDCAVGRVCERAGCCYLGEQVPSNVRAPLRFGKPPATP